LLVNLLCLIDEESVLINNN